jgi:hypothetical protein
MTLQEIILKHNLIFIFFIVFWIFLIFAFYQAFKEKL